MTLTHLTTTQDLAAWGFTEPILRIESQQPRQFRVLMPVEPADMADDPPIPYGGSITVKDDAGVIIFAGTRTQAPKDFSPRSPGQELIFQDALFLLGQTIFQQSIKSLNTTTRTLDTVYFTRVNLFQAFPTGASNSTGQQITEIIAYAAACGIAIQAGTIDTFSNQPIYPVKGITCLDALKLCLRTAPDAQVWIDPTTTPPSFHCRQRANLAASSLPWQDGATHESGRIVRREDLEVDVVQIQYQHTFDDNGRVKQYVENRTAPSGASAQVPGALVFPIDLRGGQRIDLTVAVTSLTLMPSALAWWQDKKPDLATAKYSALTMVGDPTIQDDNGNDISLDDFPNELKTGEVMSWMRNSANAEVGVIQANVTAKFAYTELDEIGRVHRVVPDTDPHEISVRVKLTNSDPGEVVYSILQHYDPGEQAPSGLETYLYSTLHEPQYQGTHTLRSAVAGVPRVTRIYGPWERLNLTGGAAAWASMNAAIQSVDVDFFHGQQTISFGPPVHLTPDELWNWIQMWSYRQVFDNPNLRLTAEAAYGTSQLGGTAAVENTTQATPLPSVATVQSEAEDVDGTTRIVHDAYNGVLKMEVVAKNAGAARVTGEKSIDLAFDDLDDGEAAQFRAMRVYRSEGGVCQYADVKVLMTEPTWTNV